jgi:hypothetical protein
MKVSVQELQRAASILLKHLEETGQNVLEIPEDFYWDVPADRRYEQYNEPKQLTVGQLSDDWAEVNRITKGEREPLGYALVWLASVLRRVGEKAVG